MIAFFWASLMLLVGLSAVGPQIASAADPDTDARVDPTNEAAATQLIKLAAEQYDQGRYDEALGTLRAARAISARPGILFNIGQVQRARRDCAGAREAYQRFLAATPPTDPNHDRALRWEAEMQACADEAAEGEALAPEKSAKMPPVTPTRSAAPDLRRVGVVQLSVANASPQPSGSDLRSSNSSSTSTSAPASASPGAANGALAPMPRLDRKTSPAATVAGWTLIGAGAIAAGTALWFQLQANNISNDLEASPHTATEVAMQLQEGNRDKSRAIWSAVVGGVLAAGGAGILILGRPANAPAVSVSWLGLSGKF
jgi:tetratricopeptide (TPR) repeat protein